MSFPVATISRPAIVPLRAIWSTGPGTWMMSAWTLPVAVVPRASGHKHRCLQEPLDTRDADNLPIQTSMEGRRRWLRLHWARFTLQSNSSASYPGKWTEASIENRRQSCHLYYPGVLAHVIVVLRGVILRALRRLPRHGTAQADRRDVRVYVRTIVKDGDASS